MKPISIFIFALCATAQITAANAATKCVKLSSSTTCTNTQPIAMSIDWTTTCITSGTSVAVSGIGVCSKNSGSVTTPVNTVSSTGGGSSNSYCWCKMVSPAVSKWVYAQQASTEDACHNYCGQYCATKIYNNATFRTALFSNMTD